jgi:hypothetical protein
MSRQLEAATSLPVGRIRAPRLARARNGRLYATHSEVVTRRAPVNLLDQFLLIGEGEDDTDAAVRFTRRFGLLQLCEKHGLPVGHNPPNVHDPDCNMPVDKVEHYKQFALCLSALRQIGADVSDGRVGDVVDWELAERCLYGEEYPFQIRSTLRRAAAAIPGSSPVARSEFQRLVRSLIRVCRIQPGFRWDKTGWSIDFDSILGSNLAAILALQLISQLGGKALRKCRECPRWFLPRGRQVYCKKCGIRAAWRSAWRTAEQKRRDALALQDDAGRTGVGRRGEKRKRRRA